MEDRVCLRAHGKMCRGYIMPGHRSKEWAQQPKEGGQKCPGISENVCVYGIVWRLAFTFVQVLNAENLQSISPRSHFPASSFFIYRLQLMTFCPLITERTKTVELPLPDKIPLWGPGFRAILSSNMGTRRPLHHHATSASTPPPVLPHHTPASIITLFCRQLETKGREGDSGRQLRCLHTNGTPGHVLPNRQSASAWFAFSVILCLSRMLHIQCTS